MGATETDGSEVGRYVGSCVGGPGVGEGDWYSLRLVGMGTLPSVLVGVADEYSVLRVGAAVGLRYDKSPGE